MTYRTFILAVLALATLAAPGGAQQKKVKKDKKLITAEEIADVSVNTAYDAVQKLRSDWLRAGQRQITVYGRTGRTGDGGTEAGSGLDTSSYATTKLAVFVDGTEVGGPEELQRIQSHRVEEMRYLSGSDAQQQYGSRYAAGVIQVKLKTS
ncbi:MAG TPA: hypothetical protein VHJ69_12870 [Gemmatimonadales bacterium]|jgi:hypothetical protein|nr:hypothetical protein [Gemmatimonadales bacterium]